MEYYGQLIKYKEENGHCNVSQRCAANAKLGRWVKNLRRSKAKGELSQERIELLNAIGFKWRMR
jgi:hypothetical protein